MAKHIQTGEQGEAIALHCLLKKGYAILEKNWRYRRAEVDLIAKDGEILVFVEVKTRTSDHFGRPEAFVTERKKQFLQTAATVYMEQIGHEWEIRFDIIAVLLHPSREAEIQHFEDAFFE